MGGGGGGESVRSMRVEMCGTAEVGSWRNSVGVKILEIVLGRVERGLERFGGMVVDVVCFFLELISRRNFEILMEEQGSVECELGRSSISFYQD